MDVTNLMMAAICICAVLAVLAGAAIIAIDRVERGR